MSGSLLTLFCIVLRNRLWSWCREEQSCECAIVPSINTWMYWHSTGLPTARGMRWSISSKDSMNSFQTTYWAYLMRMNWRWDCMNSYTNYYIDLHTRGNKWPLTGVLQSVFFMLISFHLCIHNLHPILYFPFNYINNTWGRRYAIKSHIFLLCNLLYIQINKLLITLLSKTLSICILKILQHFL